jgi:hypothetical protein
MIKTMTSKQAFEERFVTGRDIVKVSDYHGHEEGLVRHDPKCVHYNTPAQPLLPQGQEICLEGLRPECLRGTYSEGKCEGPFDALYMETTYVGAVLDCREENHYDDSDFYAVCWDEAQGKIVRVDYATTRGWTYPNGAAVDATPEVLAKAAEWNRKQLVEAYVSRDQRKAKEVKFGRWVKVVSGHKVPKGTVGEVGWQGSFGGGRNFGGNKRVGLRLKDGSMVFTSESNVEVFESEKYESKREDLERAADMNKSCWHFFHCAAGAMAIVS